MKKTYLFLTLLIIFSCQSSHSKKQIASKNQNIKYATCFDIQNFDGYKKITVFYDFSDSLRLSYDYYLVNKKANIPKEIENQEIIRTPISKAIFFSTTYLGFIEALNLRNSVAGVSGTKYICDTTLQKMALQNQIIDVGSYDNPKIEDIFMSDAPVIFTYSINGAIPPAFEKIQQYGKNIVWVNEYLETTPLGRAEWLKFFAAFYELDTLADTLFKKIAQNYENLKSQTYKNRQSPGVLFNTPFQGIWFLPGGNSYMANIVQDAGGNYLWKNIKQKSSFQINLEDIFLKNDSIDILLNPGFVTDIQNIIKIDARLAKLNCIKNGRVYNNDKLKNSNGSLYFFEQGVVQPDLILNDLIHIFHDSLQADSNLKFYRKLE